MKRWRFSDEARKELRDVLGSGVSSQVVSQIEDTVRLYRYQVPAQAAERDVNGRIALGVARVEQEARRLAKALRALTPVVQQHLLDDPLGRVERLIADTSRVREDYTEPRGKPTDALWCSLRRQVGAILAGAGLKVTSGRPTPGGRGKRGALLWEVLVIVSGEARDSSKTEDLGRDVRDVTKWLKDGGASIGTELSQTKGNIVSG